MAQGAIKKSSNPALAKGKRSKNSGPRPGAKVIKPKKAKLISKSKMLKRNTSGLTALTEKNLAEKAGHLEILKGGKKDRAGGRDAKKKGTK
ncbi:hypothetical protein BT63DRAFT_458476 [Microthyrium microscopicum]|uniref:Uncharacterized protein n=1 Tax=Microthyrium microscopicum TaxID=703497 RepID=A0A6A6U1W7_9PEZI|nr:hypothetical protein BT63DRAFT_458476 [Microthyrium microscopicum]